MFVYIVLIKGIQCCHLKTLPRDLEHNAMAVLLSVENHSTSHTHTKKTLTLDQSTVEHSLTQNSHQMHGCLLSTPVYQQLQGLTPLYTSSKMQWNPSQKTTPVRSHPSLTCFTDHGFVDSVLLSLCPIRNNHLAALIMDSILLSLWPLIYHYL